MNWHDDDKGHNRAYSDEGYLLTWAYNPHGPYYNAWAPRHDGQRRGKHLAAGYSRTDVERACLVHFQNKSRETIRAEVEARV